MLLFPLSIILFPLIALSKLPSYTLDPSLLSVSGLSSGGFMAVQLHFSHSSLFKGAAIFAGGPFACALNNPLMALTSCMSTPNFISTSTLSLTTKNLEAWD